MSRPLSDAEYKLVKYLFDQGRTAWTNATCLDMAMPEKRHQAPQAKSVYVSNFRKRPEVMVVYDELVAESKASNAQAAATMVDTIRDKATDPSDRFKTFPWEYVERANAKTGEILGYDFRPTVDDPNQIPDDLKPYVDSVKFEMSIGKFVIIPREIVSEKTRAKYADMLAKMTGSYSPERLEVSGPDGNPVETITASMDAVSASEIYRRSVKGEG
ncbi:hypothetical protein NVP1271B_81 [Vibrio phage 1.271.B._10N.286.54.B4]|nr:hypothetical protein NVP1027O_81 [Vibrio phage 1.027.O._10N.286.54.B8]AUR94634.1 hypothetical protein NVP1196O_81 [Vibrio phage 1.196.O._10N.286.54.E12]AUR95101.1 hypothetical protein NVP1200O_81 [Vibrio phage 1.200.O._10N.286.55.E1]AUR99589.1 hypothetical protein NVP1267O_81 [Vibrio phage 1.267.O._10N.286.54.A1]AUR99674.1 hypothetical protein NVP1268A_81 [Vibrio phage 1.268.A._10N.286.54.A11]AUR99759.1 hypothetical protein NVP1268B_81 [Vibrio phage 1.268.B._10N.286.54.A11]AUS00103.1 hypot